MKINIQIRDLLQKTFILCIFLFTGGLLLYLPTFVKWLRKKEELVLYTFADLLDNELIEKFEKQHGIKVNVKNFELDSEIWTQLFINKGAGADLITPSSNIVTRLSKAELIQKIDFSRLSNADNLHPLFCDKRQDCIIKSCSVPFAWSFYALGYNKKSIEKLQRKPSSLAAIFDPGKYFGVSSSDYKVVIYEDNPQELLLLGSLFLYGHAKKSFDHETLKEIKRLYSVHKHKWLYSYINANIMYYLTFAVPVLLTFASHLKNIIEEHPEDFDMAIPEEGSVLVLQNFAIPKKSKNVDAAYKFINYIMQDSVMMDFFNYYGYLPAKKNVLDEIRQNFSRFVPSEEQMKRFISVDQNITPEQAESFWIGVKSF